MVSKKRLDTPKRGVVASHSVMLGGAGLLLGAGLLGVLVYGQMQTSAQVAQLSHNVSALAHAIETQGREEGSRSEDMADAIDRAMERRAAAERAAKRDAMLAPYRDLAVDVPPGDWVYGDPDARFTLYTYADPNCPHCQTFHDTPKQLVNTSRGVMNAQYHHMTIMAANSTTQALASECAGRLSDNQHFWAMIDFVYDHPQEQRRGLLDAAETLGFDRGEFSQCMDSREMRDYVAARGQEAQREGVTGTPTSFLIDNRTGESVRLAGAQPAGAIVQALQQMLQAQQERSGSAEAEG